MLPNASHIKKPASRWNRSKSSAALEKLIHHNAQAVKCLLKKQDFGATRAERDLLDKQAHELNTDLERSFPNKTHNQLIRNQYFLPSRTNRAPSHAIDIEKANSFLVQIIFSCKFSVLFYPTRGREPN